MKSSKLEPRKLKLEVKIDKTKSLAALKSYL